MPKGERPYEFYDNVHVGIVYEINLDRRRIQRSVYSLLDWIGDVGGLLEAMFVVFSVLIVIYQYKTFEIYMIHNLFKLRLPETKNNQELFRIQPMEQVSKFRLFVFNVVNFFCKKVSKSLCSKSNINLDRYKKAHKSLNATYFPIIKYDFLMSY